MREIFLFFLVFVAACKLNSQSDVKVTNGVPASDRFPEVVQILATAKDGSLQLCSGTFLSGYHLITAAHCFFDENGDPVSKVSFRSADGKEHIGRAIYPNSFNPKAGVIETIGDDVGFLVFDRPVHEHFAKGSFVPLQPKENITLVGFGMNNQIDSSGAGIRRLGQNQVMLVNENVSIISGYSKDSVTGMPLGVSSASALGDSGGAVFNAKGELVGVIGSGSLYDFADHEGTKLSRSFVLNLGHEKSIHLLKEIKQKWCTN